MKKFILFAMLLSITATSFSQQTNPAKPVTRADYLQKSKKQKTAAWVLLGGGTVLIGTGFLIGNRKESSFGEAATGGIIGGIGVLSMIGSIPLFIASSKNKRRAMSVSFKTEKTLQIQNHSLSYRPVPSLTLKIQL